MRGDPVSHTVAVIGAGLAGLSCARALAAAGATVSVYEKSRGAGGRMATRRALATAFDHGAQYFTVRDVEFARLLAPLTERGSVAPFVARWGAGAPEDPQLWVGVPGMADVGRGLGRGLVVNLERRITALTRDGASWRLDDADGTQHGPYDRVVVAVPAPQALLLAGLPAPLAAALSSVAMEPCLALMATFGAPLATAFDVDWRPDPVLPFVCRNNSKPDRGATEAWVLHADAQWSETRFAADEAQVTAELVAALARRLGGAPVVPSGTVLHRWRYARVSTPLDQDCLYDAPSGVGLCGDWCLAARVEAAFQSGTALAARLLSAG